MPSSCARNEIADALAEAFPTMDDLARFRLANALHHAAERAVFESLDQALALVPLRVRVEEAESLAARLREVVAEMGVHGASDNGPIPIHTDPVWHCFECDFWASLSNNARGHRTQTGHRVYAEVGADDYATTTEAERCP